MFFFKFKKLFIFILFVSFYQFIAVNVYAEDTNNTYRENYLFLTLGMSFSRFNPIGLTARVVFELPTQNKISKSGFPVLNFEIEYGPQAKKVNYGIGTYGMVGMILSASKLTPYTDFDEFDKGRDYHGVEMSLILFGGFFEIYYVTYNFSDNKTHNYIQSHGLKISYPV